MTNGIIIRNGVKYAGGSSSSSSDVKVVDVVEKGNKNAVSSNAVANAVEDYVNNSNSYSTTETVVGKWIDGKPIYRRYLTFQLPEDASYTAGEPEKRTLIEFIQEDIDTVIDANGAINMTNGYVVPVPYNFGLHEDGKQQNNCWYFNKLSKKLTISLWVTPADYNNSPGYLFVYFTKTTG